MRPIRVQRLRAKGWRMPPNTVYVGCPTKWGNPWTVRGAAEAGYSVDESVCVEAYRAWLLGSGHWAHGSPLDPVPILEPLRGKSLACWCPLDRPCHADVLLELANR